ncbi:MAG: hypothetical protein M0D55_13435 [Elusimicrobiota bacterium]|nr:MAG: hypothetical protein M0D55_13435 [Elusimicrobiota bacterium]
MSRVAVWLKRAVVMFPGALQALVAGLYTRTSLVATAGPASGPVFPPATSTQPLTIMVAVCEARATPMPPTDTTCGPREVATSSEVASTAPVWSTPPAIRTSPVASKVAVCATRRVCAEETDDSAAKSMAAPREEDRRLIVRTVIKLSPGRARLWLGSRSV